MSVKTMTRIWEHSTQTSSDLLLLLAIADHADDDGVCWPGIDKLAKKTRCLPRQVKRNIQKLAGRGELFIQQNRGRGHTNLYFILAGFDAAEIASVLQRRFELDEASAKRISQDTLKMQSDYKKGVTKDTIKPKEKVSSRAVKGVIQDKKVSSRAVKGVIAMTPEPLEPSFKPSMNNDINSSSPSSILQQAKTVLSGTTTRAAFEQIIAPCEARPGHDSVFVVAVPKNLCQQVRRYERNFLQALNQFTPVDQLEVIEL